MFQIFQRLRPAIDGLQRVDQHDLAVEPGEVIAEEGAHHDRLVGFETALHHGLIGALRRRAVSEADEGCKGQCRRAFKVAGHEKAAGWQHGERAFVRLAGFEIGRIGLRHVAHHQLVSRRVRVYALGERQPFPRQGPRMSERESVCAFFENSE